MTITLSEKARQVFRDTLNALHNDEYRDDTHCVHGCFVGDWAGPDYMCSYCESGVLNIEYAFCAAKDYDRHMLRAAKRVFADLMFNPMVEFCNSDQYKALSRKQQTFFLDRFMDMTRELHK